MTQALAETGANVKSVEIDESLLPILRKTLEGYDNVEIIHGDILKVDLKDITGGKPFTVAANLPYYITTPIIFSLLEANLPLKRIVVMVQKEVAERMAARPGTKAYGPPFLGAAVLFGAPAGNSRSGSRFHAGPKG